jgi:hypothetical protein
MPSPVLLILLPLYGCFVLSKQEHPRPAPADAGRVGESCRYTTRLARCCIAFPLLFSVLLLPMGTDNDSLAGCCGVLDMTSYRHGLYAFSVMAFESMWQ